MAETAEMAEMAEMAEAVRKDVNPVHNYYSKVPNHRIALCNQATSLLQHPRSDATSIIAN